MKVFCTKNDLFSFLFNEGYNVVDGYGNTPKNYLTVLVEESNMREKTFKELAEKYGWYFNSENTPRWCSLGVLEVGDFKVIVKKRRVKNERTKGQALEHKMNDIIKKFVENGKQVNITFESDCKRLSYKGIVFSEEVGDRSWRKGERNKADLHIHDVYGNTFAISLKLNTSHWWETASTYLYEQTKMAIEGLIDDECCVTIVDEDTKRINIVHNIAWCLSRKQMKDLMFGDDIYEHGCIVKSKTNIDYEYDEKTNTLIFHCQNVITEVDDVIGTDLHPFALLYNSKKRRSGGYLGVQIAAVTKSRVTSKNIVWYNF